jgi:hypothetical protein
MDKKITFKTKKDQQSINQQINKQQHTTLEVRINENKYIKKFLKMVWNLGRVTYN